MAKPASRQPYPIPGHPILGGLLFTLLLLFPTLSPLQAGNDWLGKVLDTAGEAIGGGDEQTEIKLGQQVDADIAKKYGFLNDRVQGSRVNAIGQKMASLSPRNKLNYSFKIINTDEINAFAAPGGFVYVTKGLLNLVKSDQELAGVLGHEIMHIGCKHSMKAMGQAGLIQAGIGILLGDKNKDNAWAKMGGSLGGNFLQLHMSREHEFEADDKGMELAAKAGFNPNGLRMFLVRLQEKSGKHGEGTLAEITKWLSTHPETGDRIKKAEAKIVSLGFKVENLPEDKPGSNPVNNNPIAQNPNEAGYQPVKEKTLYISKLRTPLRQGPGSASPVVAQIGRNSAVTAIGVNGDYVLVKYGNSRGWIAKKDLSQQPVQGSGNNAPADEPVVSLPQNPSNQGVAGDRVKAAEAKLAELENSKAQRSKGIGGWFRKVFPFLRSAEDKKLDEQIELAKGEVETARLNAEFEQQTGQSFSGNAIVPMNGILTQPLSLSNQNGNSTSVKNSAPIKPVSAGQIQLKNQAVPSAVPPQTSGPVTQQSLKIRVLFQELQKARESYVSILNNSGATPAEKDYALRAYQGKQAEYDSARQAQ